MRLTKRQKENASKYFLDISKYAFGAVVVGKFISLTSIPEWVFWLGLCFAVLTFLSGIFLDKGGD